MTPIGMEKAHKALASAKILLEAGNTDGATNRAYYAIFDAAMAALSWTGSGTDQSQAKTHTGLIGSFGQHLVKAGHLQAEFGRSFNRVHELRLTADYLAEPVPTDKAHWAINEAASFLAAISGLLAQSESEPPPAA